ncbi:MAG: PEP-CTERM sorting domain-containing protein [Roseateles sp.]|uniref:PEP-CTERM sorting domain-containing protein n=1 Tax=Roseateles sp. TaxID=1971397 RepID=UPI0039E8CA2D
MHNDNPAPRARLLSLLVAAACGGLSATAAADPAITLTAAYALNGVAVPDALPEGSIFATPEGADFYLNRGEGGSSVFFHTYGFVGSPTYFGARASGEGLDFYAKTSALYSGTYTNTTGSAVMLNFGFNLEGGEVALWGDGDGMANLRLQIRRNGQVVSQGDTLVTQSGANFSCLESDIGALGAWAGCAAATSNHVHGAGGAYSVDMGLVAAGETITIDYDIVSTVSGQYVGGAVGSGDCYGGYGGYGEAVALAEDTPHMACVIYNGIARSGDPFDGNGLGPSADFSLTATAVALPEPGSLALLAAAGGGGWLGWRRRRGGRPG